MELSKQEYWGGLPFPTPGNHPNPEIEPMSLVSCLGREILYHSSSRVPETKGLNRFSQLRDLLFQFVHLSAWTYFLLLAGLPLPVERVGSRLVRRDVSPGCYSWWGFAKTGLFFPETSVLLRVKVISRETNCRGIDFWPHEERLSSCFFL